MSAEAPGTCEVLHGGKRQSSIARHDLPINLPGAELSVPPRHLRTATVVSSASHPGYPSTSYAGAKLPIGQGRAAALP